ncbi:hypothetical protein NECAME_14316 [Necator americanus]|uniref:Uncharacterized protein n=1 Tax=Necator americanus TaxID=51031 RepID=W2SRG3_NECAM|nr:hypothetical protein NECAME_14316 [Necator americanus]ETN71262.1 hypothetical protein NECAME_14316 [Necator americanus]
MEHNCPATVCTDVVCYVIIDIMVAVHGTHIDNVSQPQLLLFLRSIEEHLPLGQDNLVFQ